MYMLFRTACVNDTSSFCNSAISEFLEASNPPIKPKAVTPLRSSSCLFFLCVSLIFTDVCSLLYRSCISSVIIFSFSSVSFN